MTIYSQVEEAIKKNESEISHLEDELRMLRSVEKDTPRESYQRQLERIEYHIEQQKKYLRQNKSLMYNYKFAYEGMMELRKLRELYDKEEDPQVRSEINEKIESLSQNVSISMDSLTDDLADELRISILNSGNVEEKIIKEDIIEDPEIVVPVDDNGEENDKEEQISYSDEDGQVEDIVQETSDSEEDGENNGTDEKSSDSIDDENLQNSYSLLKEELKEAEKEYQESLERMQGIFDEERDRKLNGDLFTTVEELDAFYDKYMQMKVDENEVQKAALRRIEELREKINAIEEQMSKNNDSPEVGKEPRKVEKPEQTIDYTPGKPPIGIPILQSDDNSNDTAIGLPGPTIGDEKPRLPGPTIGDEKPRLPGPTIGEIPRLPGPIAGEEKDKPERKKGKRDLIDILDDIVDGLEIKAKEGKKYRASEIKVFDGFKQELSSGNYLYNIVHFLPAVVKIPFKLLSKSASKLMTTYNAKHNIKVIKKRLAKLPYDDLMTIYTEYRAGQFGNVGLPSLVNILIDERMQQFALENVAKINANLEKQYTEVFDTISTLDMIDAALKTERSEKEKENLMKYREHILKGQAQKIESIRGNYKKANEWLSGGIHGFSEDVKASITKLSYVGMRFAKEHDLDGELLKQQRALKDAENEAIANNDNEKALRAFVQHEMLLSNNTQISNSIFGKRSTGKRYYNPLAVQMDYRDDPFVRDLFTSIVIASSAISAINAVKTHVEAERIFQEQKDAIAKDEQIIGQARQAGQDIVGKRGTMMEGMSSQANQDVLNVEGQIERAVLDKHGWKFTNAYRADDKAGHSFFNSFYENTQHSLQDIAAKYNAGTITQHEAMELLSNVTNNNQQILSTVSDECMKILKPYASSHPQFDLASAQGVMDFIVKNPSAISDMHKAIVDIDSIGETLSGLTPAHVTAYNSLPSDLQTTLFAAASSVALATNVSNTMTNNVKKGKYGSEVTDMVREYAQQQAQTQEQSSGKEK